MFIKSKWSLLIWLIVCFTAQAKTELIIGLTAQGIRVASIEEVELGFNHQLENFTKDKNYLLKINVLQNDEQLASMLESRQIIGYFGTPFLAIQNQALFDFDLMFSPVLNDKVKQRYVLLVRKDSAINDLAQLKGTSLSYCIADEMGILFLQKLLKDQKLSDIHTFFEKMMVKKNPNLAISSVFFKNAKATIVLDADFKIAAELNPQLNTQLSIIETSPEYITNVLATTNDIKNKMSLSEYESIVLNIGSTIQSKKLLKSFNYGQLHKIESEDLDSVRDLMHNLNADKGLAK